jgi:hypothetical protein
MADHDEILRRQRAKMDEHRAWLAQQQAAIREMGVTALIAPSPTAVKSQSQEQVDHRASYSAASPSSGGGYRYGGQYDGSAAAGGASPADFSDSRQMTARSIGSPLNVHARSTQWAKRREQKLEELKSVRENENEQDCPFTPEIHDAHSLSTGRQHTSAERVRGYGSFLQRQENARVLKEDKILKIKCDGSKWTNAPTVPEEFHLGTRNQRPIKALKQPLRAPSSRTPAALHELLHDPTVPTALDAAEAIGAPPRGLFSTKTSTAIIDVATRRQAP